MKYCIHHPLLLNSRLGYYELKATATAIAITTIHESHPYRYTKATATALAVVCLLSR